MRHTRTAPGPEQGIYQLYKLALYLYAVQIVSGTYHYEEEENILRLQVACDGFYTS